MSKLTPKAKRMKSQEKVRDADMNLDDQESDEPLSAGLSELQIIELKELIEQQYSTISEKMKSEILAWYVNAHHDNPEELRENAKVYLKGIFRGWRIKDEEIAAACIDLVDSFVNKIMMAGKSSQSNQVLINMIAGLAKNIPEGAFKTLYEDHGGETAFLKHLEKQVERYTQNQGKLFPFFAIVQSSGYGKSKLMDHLSKTHDGTKGDRPRTIYLSFAPKEAFPNKNVDISTELEQCSREDVERAFVHLFEDALENAGKNQFKLKKQEHNRIIPSRASGAGQRTIFALDEVSELLKHHALGRVSFFRCFRKATVQFWNAHNGCFFVILSTFSSINQALPGIRHDPSNKYYLDRSEWREPLKSFFLHESLGLRNNENDILGMDINKCHKDRHLLAMGRPLWRAYIGEMAADAKMEPMIEFALAKLLLATPAPDAHELSTEQTIAMLSCRLCLSISAVSWVASSVVAGHMATVTSISENREEHFVTYPSEPALALASRLYMKENGNFLKHALAHLKQYYTSGLVLKGQRGELIVRLLNLLAIDKCMFKSGSNGYKAVAEVPLKDFLAQFNRPGASLTDLLKPGKRSAELNDKQKKVLRDLNFHGKLCEPPREGDDKEWNGKVCFTHFVYVERADDGQPLFTPDLLRYAYRRTAAMAMDAGRRGIDWIIPVRVNDDDKFVGLCGQDKNRMNDKLEALLRTGNPETSYKISTDYFLSQEEKKLFETKKWDLHWPTVLFSVGSDEIGVAVSELSGRLLRSQIEMESPFPCIVLAGLNYDKLMGKEENTLLEELRYFVKDQPSAYKKTAPLTYGIQNPEGYATDLPNDKMDVSS